MPADATSEQLAEALSTGDDRQRLVQILDGPAPTTDDALVETARQLVETRDRIDRGGVSALAASDQFVAFESSSSTQREDVS